MSVAHRWVLVIIFAALVGLLLFGLSSAAVDATYRERDFPLELLRPQLVTRREAPDFDLLDRTGRHQGLSALKGRPVVLNFWSSECPPCLEELPALIRLDEMARHRGTFSVVTVTIDEGWDEVRPLFPGAAPPKLVVLFDPEKAVVEGQYGTTKFPETFLIDRRGLIRARFDGQRNWANPVVLNIVEGL